MTDPFEALREPVTLVDPDPDFAGRLRLRLTREVFAPPGGTMSQQTIATRQDLLARWYSVTGVRHDPRTPCRRPAGATSAPALRRGRRREPGRGPAGDRDRDYGGTAATRAFWERRGFTQVNTIDPLPGWQPRNPAAIYAAALRPAIRST
jgi:hypothetical protein